MPLVGMVIFFYPAEVTDRTRKGVGKTPVCPFEVTSFRGLEDGSPIERSGASSSISLPPQLRKKRREFATLRNISKEVLRDH